MHSMLGQRCAQLGALPGLDVAHRIAGRSAGRVLGRDGAYAYRTFTAASLIAAGVGLFGYQILTI